jgi:hypothetical protein
VAGERRQVKLPVDPAQRTVDLDALAEKANLRATPYDPAKDREDARRRLAYGLLGLLTAVVVALLGASFADWISLAETKDLAAAILSPIVVLVGTALGFYFGGQGE